MTECNQKGIGFSSLGRRKIEADFDGGTLTSDAGGLLLREADRTLGLTQALAECMIRQRIYGIALGYEDLNDHNELRHDALMQLAVECEQELASSPTLCRMENRIDNETLAQLSEVFVESFIRTSKSSRSRGNGTVLYGSQKL